jgi:predicted DNA binding CopG/RHH family protein
MSVETLDAIQTLNYRTKRMGGLSYKLREGYGLDVASEHVLEYDPKRMSCVIPYADGTNRDGVGDYLEVGGIDTSRHSTNQVVLFDHGKGEHKYGPWPIAMAWDSETKTYTNKIDPVAKRAWVTAFFYQGKGVPGMDKGDEYDFALHCEQIYDLVTKGFFRSGSIGYQVKAAREIPPDYAQGIPKGLHLLAVKMLEASLVIMPANPDTVGKGFDPVREVLCNGKLCGKAISPYLVKSLEPYQVETKAQMGWEAGRVESKGVQQGQKVRIGDRIQGVYMRGLYRESEFSGKIVGISSDTAGGNFGMAEIKLDSPLPIDGSTGLLITLDGRGQIDDNKYELNASLKSIKRKSYATNPLEARDDYENPLSNSDVPNSQWRPGMGAKLKSLRRKYRKGIKSWESFRTQALRIVQHEALPLQRFEMLLEQYHDGDIRIEELLSEYPMLLNLAELEGVKGLKGWKPVPRDPMDAPRRAMERMSRSELASKVRNRYAEAHPGEEDTSAVDTSRMSKEEMIEIALNGWKSLSKAITMEEREKLREARDVLAKPNSVMLLGGMSKEEARRIVNELERKVGRGMPQRSRLVNQSKGFVPPFKVEELDVDLLAVVDSRGNIVSSGYRDYQQAKEDAEWRNTTNEVGTPIRMKSKSLSEDEITKLKQKAKDNGLLVRATSRSFEVYNQMNQMIGVCPTTNFEMCEFLLDTKIKNNEYKTTQRKSLSNVRLKYRSPARRRLRKSIPGQSSMNVRSKDLEKVKAMAGERGLKFQLLGPGDEGIDRVKLIGDDENIDAVAKRFGKGLNARVKGQFDSITPEQIEAMSDGEIYKLFERMAYDGFGSTRSNFDSNFFAVYGGHRNRRNVPPRIQKKYDYFYQHNTNDWAGD